MASVQLPPIVRAWTQNFQWTMGLTHLGFLQDIASWYARTTPVHTDVVASSPASMSAILEKRTNSATGNAFSMSQVTLRGIQRACYVAGVEYSNFFMTGYMWFCIGVLLLFAIILAAKFCCDYIIKVKSSSFRRWYGPRGCWGTLTKGMLYRLVRWVGSILSRLLTRSQLFFSFLPFVIITFNELKEKNSIGACVLAVWTILCIFVTLGESTYYIIKLRKRSLQIHNNAAYLLYSKNEILNRWGFLFTPYRASHCWFLAPTLVYFLLKGAFIGASQSNSTHLAVAVAVLDVLYFIATVVLNRTWTGVSTA